MANQLITLDLTAVEWTNQIVKGHIKDGELQVYDVQINESRIPKDLTTFKSGQFRGTNHNGEFVVKDIGVFAKDGKFTFKFPKTAFSVAGNFKQAYFVFTDSGGGQVSTEDFNILVLPDADADAQHADALVDEYNKFVKQLQDAYDKKVADWDKQVADLEKKVAELKAAIDKLDFYTKSQADNRFLIKNVSDIGADTDWNTANTTGIYHVIAAKGPNCPTGSAATYGDLLVVANGGWIEQHYFGATSGGHEYVRAYSGSPASWGRWYSIITDKNHNIEYGNLTTIDKPDFNTLTTVGNYYVTNPQAGKNGPINMTAWGRLEVRSVGVAYNQTYHSDTNNQLWTRNYITTTKTWTPWQQIATTGDMIYRMEIPGVNGAASPAHLNVNKIARTCILQIDSKLPLKTGTMYWIPKEYAQNVGNLFIRTGNATLAIYGNGNVELINNDSDVATTIGTISWGY